FQPAFPADMLEIIKQNRVQSMLVDDRRVDSVSRKAPTAALFGRHHPYGAVAEHGDVTGVERDQLIRFFRTHYRPERCRILVTGLDPDRYLPLIDQALGQEWPRGEGQGQPGPDTLPEPQPASSSRIVLPMEDAVQSSIRMGKPLFSRKDPDFNGLSVVNTILGGYFGSRLMKNIREEKGLTYGISSHLVSLRDHGFFMVGSTVEAGSADAALRECRVEMIRLASERVPQAELDLVRNYLIAQVQRSIDGPIQAAEQFRSLWLHEMDFRQLLEYIRLIEEITPEQIRTLAARHLDPGGMIEVVAGPGAPRE
ncbi:MAG: pitrilysin family protein, partial [Bacteroidales bacterium]